MIGIALKMLLGDRAKFIGILIGLTFASLLITQQAGIFVGLMTRTYGFISDTAQPNIWVMDPNVRHVDDVKPMSDAELYRVRGIEGVEWAVPLYKGLLSATLPNGDKEIIWVIGLDDSTLIGGPHDMVQGKLSDLRQSNSVIIDKTEANDKLFAMNPDGTKRNLQVGDMLEINDNYVMVVGISENLQTFQAQPVIYTTYTRALKYAPPQRQLLSFVLAKTAPDANPLEVANRITEKTGLLALTRQQFIDKTYDYYMEHTGIPINFGIAVALGFIVGTVIAGQTFYNFALENLRYFGTFKAMGASNALILKMMICQALVVGVIGYAIGIGLASIFGFFVSQTILSFKMPWWLLLVTAGAILFISISAALVSSRRVMKLEPAVVFRS